MVEELGLPFAGQEMIQHVLFGGVQTSVEAFNRSKLTLMSSKGGCKFEIEALGKKEICGEIARVPKGPWMKKLKELKIFVSDVGDGTPKIDLLLGAKDLALLITGKMEVITNSLVAIETKVGWTLMGESPAKCHSFLTTSIASNCISLHLTGISIDQLWNLETIGIRDPVEVKTKEVRDEEVRLHFLETVSRSEDGRYKVALPWVNGRQSLPDNRYMAEKRLDSTTRKLMSLQKYEDYEDIFKKWLEEGIIEDVPKDEVQNKAFYLPHHAVFKPASLTTPVRPVFDASCKSGRNPSLNECLEKGPNTLDLIPDILLRFREGKVGAISDIRKAFLMIDVEEKDRDCLRFLWWTDPKAKKHRVFRHRRVVFGVNSSPYLLAAVIQFHLNNVVPEDKEAADLLLKSLYVDNCVVSHDTHEQYEDFRERTTRIMKEAGMELRLWQCSTGEESRVGSLSSSDCGLETSSSSTVDNSHLTSVLGLLWNTEDDTLGIDLSLNEVPEKISKRSVLSATQRVYDPVGFTCPALLLPKLLLQESWAQKTSWDEELLEEAKSRFKRWFIQLPVLKKIRIKRNCTGMISDRSSWQIHMFCDASSIAFAACIFLRTALNGVVSIQLLQARSRIAPVKKATIPRLELLSCTIGARLYNSVKKSLSLENTPVFLWTDSTTALAWIQRNDDWGTFVGNRVREILSLTQASDWRHIPGIHNPADLPSRGCNPTEVLSSRWWEGPEWLRLPSHQWPTEVTEVKEEEVAQEKKKISRCTSMTSAVIHEDLSWFCRSSSYHKNLRILSYVRRFVLKVQKKNVSVDLLTLEEIEDTEKIVLKLLQQKTFSKVPLEVSGIITKIDEEGIRRVRTKLLYKEDSVGFKMPILLPHSHPIVDSIILEEHGRNCHAGVQFLMGHLREKYWILQGRKAVRNIVRKCVICRRFSAKKSEANPSALPVDRVSTGKVFEIVGVDLAGPLFMKTGKKAWIVIFTCSVYRCVHLELVKTLNTETFLEAFSRFISRRGRPEKIYSDNGKNFLGTDNLFRSLDWQKISEECGLKRIQWIFNPPTAAWWGGWWERLIGTVKSLLRRILGKSKLSFERLNNYLCEVEAVINGRPLTTVTEDPDDLQPLTPAMFLHELPNPVVFDLELLDASGFQRIFAERKQMTEELKMRFRKEYLSQLVQRGKEIKVQLRVGDVVLIGADNKKRWEWPMGRILELIQGKDGHCRVAKVRTQTGV